MTVAPTALARRRGLALVPDPVRDRETGAADDHERTWLKGGEPLEIGEKVAALDARQGAHEKQCEERQKTIMDTLGELRGDLKLLRNSMVVFLMGLMTWGALEIWSRRDFVAPSGAITSFARGFLR